MEGSQKNLMALGSVPTFRVESFAAGRVAIEFHAFLPGRLRLKRAEYG
jgi:hypothetical protein